MTGRQKINLDPDIAALLNAVTRRCRATTRCGSDTAVHGHVIRAYQPSWQAAIHPGRDVASYLSGQNLLSSADPATRGWFTRTDARKKRRWLTEQASRRADARQHYLCWPRGLVWSETPDALNADILQTLTQRYLNNEKKTSA